MRICLANGYLLCNEELETKLFESITVYTWDANEQRWKGSFLYEKPLENVKVVSFNGQPAHNAENVAEAIA